MTIVVKCDAIDTYNKHILITLILEALLYLQ